MIYYQINLQLVIKDENLEELKSLIHDNNNDDNYKLFKWVNKLF